MVCGSRGIIEVSHIQNHNKIMRERERERERESQRQRVTETERGNYLTLSLKQLYVVGLEIE